MKNILIIFTVLLISCSESEQLSGQDNNQNIPGKNHFEYISNLKLPAELTWCGEKIPLDDPEVKERAEREFYLLLQQPGQILLYLKRSGRYFPMYDSILKKMGLPSDLKYLSVAESALYMSLSDKGAMGLWQFIPSTGRMYDLHISEFVDERKHPEKSTTAALKYLESGYESLGSWMLAAAGYNMGHTNVKSNLSKQSADTYFDLFLNPETSRFIFRIALIKELMLNGKRYGFYIPESEKYAPYKVKTIICDYAIPDLSEWAAKNGTTLKDVKILNPWILQKELRSPLSGKPYEINIPAK